MRRNERERIYQKKQKKEEQPNHMAHPKGREKRKKDKPKEEPKEEANWLIKKKVEYDRWLAETLEGSCVVDDLR